MTRREKVHPCSHGSQDSAVALRLAYPPRRGAVARRVLLLRIERPQAHGNFEQQGVYPRFSVQLLGLE